MYRPATVPGVSASITVRVGARYCVCPTENSLMYPSAARTKYCSVLVRCGSRPSTTGSFDPKTSTGLIVRRIAKPVDCPYSTVHSLSLLSPGFRNGPNTGKTVVLRGSEHTQFAPSSVQRCSAASAGEANAIPAASSKPICKYCPLIAAPSLLLHRESHRSRRRGVSAPPVLIDTSSKSALPKF